MIRPLSACFFVLSLVISLVIGKTAAADAAREISWDDLAPPGPALVDPYENLEMDDKVELTFINDIRRQRELGYLSDKHDNVAYAREIEAKLTAKGLNVEGLLVLDKAFRAEIEARGREVRSEFDGRMVRMPGYALPLEATGKAVSKLLLVPYVGACIHVPPPPPNQLIVVDLKTPYKVENLYDPVWITGRLSVKTGKEALDFVDGVADVESGYALYGTEIKPYEQ